MTGTVHPPGASMPPKRIGMRPSVMTAALVWATCSLLVPDLHAASKSGTALVEQRNSRKCASVGGTISTNFIGTDTTLGSVTGDLAGGISATLLELTPGENGKLVGRVQHNGWVTDSGDALRLAEALIDLTVVSEGVFYGNYRPMTVVGGTGRFQDATGTLFAYGVLDSTRGDGEVVLRYRGEVCPGK
jgi:hypothetical protein